MPTDCDQSDENVRMCDSVHAGSGMNVKLNIVGLFEKG